MALFVLKENLRLERPFLSKMLANPHELTYNTTLERGK